MVSRNMTSVSASQKYAAQGTLKQTDKGQADGQ